jgi:hypothetical protein
LVKIYLQDLVFMSPDNGLWFWKNQEYCSAQTHSFDQVTTVRPDLMLR